MDEKELDRDIDLDKDFNPWRSQTRYEFTRVNIMEVTEQFINVSNKGDIVPIGNDSEEDEER